MQTALSLALEALPNAKPRPLRGTREFAEQEIIVPDGPYKGERFRASTQPVCRLYFAEIDSGRWQRIAVTAPSQSGKTLMVWAIPAMRDLFELAETIIIGAPEVMQAQDKWRIDLEPMIRASRYRDLLPIEGPGARGGETHLIQLRHGPAIRFMAGSGDDKSRAAFTAKSAYLTETDGMDEARAGSREADPITQIEQRTKAYGNRARVVMECTPSIKEGRIWREYESGSHSRIVSPCVHCGAWVTPERDDLIGWKGAETERQAEAEARWKCPKCAAVIDERERRSMVEDSRLVHKGQEIDTDGTITGPEPGSRTLGFRWNAFHNLMAPPGELGAREWIVAKMEDGEREIAERGLRQFAHALPAGTKAESAKDAREIHALERIDRTLPRGTIPEWCEHLTLGVDVGERVIHWTLGAWTRSARGHVVDYAIEDLPDAPTPERRILVGLRAIRDRALKGWAWKGGVRKVDLMLVDSGDHSKTVYGFGQEPDSAALVECSKGYGAGQAASRAYLGPKTTGSVNEIVSDDGWHVASLAKSKVRLIEFDADRWKTWLAARTESPMGGPGALSIFEGDARTHHAFAAHLRAEKRALVYAPGKGMVAKWQAGRSPNHWLDSTVLCCLAASMRGCSPLKVAPPPREESADPAPAPTKRPVGKPPPPRRPLPRSIPRPYGGSML